jgi:hypothetical protein
MTITAPARRPSVAARRAGYVIAFAINAALLYVINIQPGWQALPFLTDSTSEVLGLVNISLAAGLAVNVAYFAHDARWVKALGDLITAGIGLAVAIRVWQVFPFEFHGSFDWALPVRILLVVTMAGTGIAIVVQMVTLTRLSAAHNWRASGRHAHR